MDLYTLIAKFLEELLGYGGCSCCYGIDGGEWIEEKGRVSDDEEEEGEVQIYVYLLRSGDKCVHFLWNDEKHVRSDKSYDVL